MANELLRFLNNPGARRLGEIPAVQLAQRVVKKALGMIQVACMVVVVFSVIIFFLLPKFLTVVALLPLVYLVYEGWRVVENIKKIVDRLEIQQWPQWDARRWVDELTFQAPLCQALGRLIPNLAEQRGAR